MRDVRPRKCKQGWIQSIIAKTVLCQQFLLNLNFRNEWAARESVVAAGPAERGCGFFDFFLYLFGIVDVAQSGCSFWFLAWRARRGWIEDTRMEG